MTEAAPFDAFTDAMVNQRPDAGIPADLRRIDRLAFTGERTLALLDRPEPAPVVAGIPPAGHFTLNPGASFAGKTATRLWVDMARARGVAPWPGAPVLPRGRVLFYSIDEAPEQVARRIHALSRHHPGGFGLSRYADAFTIVGPDREIPPDALAPLRFTENGLNLLEDWLKLAKAEGRAFGAVTIDAYADMLPPGESENDNAEATRIGAGLEALAVAHGAAICMVHHSGKLPKGVSPETIDPRDLGRGGSALAAKARAIFTLEEVPGMPHLRLIRSRTNLGPGPKPLRLEVTEDSHGEGLRIDFFRPHDPFTAYRPQDYLPADGEWISTNELARRLSNSNGEPTGEQKRLARELRSTWAAAGLVETRTGARHAQELRLLGFPNEGQG